MPAIVLIRLLIFSESLVVGLTLDDVEYWQDRLDTVSKEQVDATLRKYFNTTYRNAGVNGYLMQKTASHKNEEQEGK